MSLSRYLLPYDKYIYIYKMLCMLLNIYYDMSFGVIKLKGDHDTDFRQRLKTQQFFITVSREFALKRMSLKQTLKKYAKRYEELSGRNLLTKLLKFTHLTRLQMISPLLLH